MATIAIVSLVVGILGLAATIYYGQRSTTNAASGAIADVVGQLFLGGLALIILLFVGRSLVGAVQGGEESEGTTDSADSQDSTGQDLAGADAPAALSLAALETVDAGTGIRFAKFSTEPVAMNGEDYLNAVSVSACSTDEKGRHSLQFALADGHRSFTADFGVLDGAPTGTYAVLEVLVDGRRAALVDAEVGRTARVEVPLRDGSTQIQFDLYPDPEAVRCDDSPGLGNPTFSANEVEGEPSQMEDLTATYLDELVTVDERWDPSEQGLTSYDGRFYQRSMAVNDCVGDDRFEHTFNLGRSYNSLSTGVGFTDRTVERSADDGWSARVSFLVDGEVVDAVEVVAGGDVEAVTVDTTGALRLGVVVETLHGGVCGRILDKELVGVTLLAPRLFIGDVGDATPLEDVELVAGFIDYDLRGDIPINGVVYPESFTYCQHLNSDPSALEFNLGRDYTIFFTTIGMADTTPDDWVGQFEFFVDGELAWSGEAGVGTSNDVQISVKDGLRLLIVLTPLAGKGCSTDPPFGLALGTPRLQPV